ncbi:MAG TPA: aminotransferase class IV [Tepidisphaeraceae bacterium]|jgi:branched-chain amino acid aminotransferase|nr:aminotransferase class IV [Tepidisphaeraceae bacterium]
MPTVWINGQFKDDAEAGVSLRDSGLLHAAGVFTTMRAYGGRVFRMPQHLRRLRDSCDALFIPLPHKDEALTAAAEELLGRNELGDARLRLTVTRGAVTQDPLHGMRLEPTVFLTCAALEAYPLEYYERGMTVILLDEQKLNPYDIQAGHKTLDYLSRFAGLRAATQRKAGEAIWFNVHNYLQSGSISNVFLVEEEKLLTPPTNFELRAPSVAAAVPYPRSNVLPGITRAAVIELARELGIEVQVAAVDVNRLLAAQEVFLTNSIMGLMPVCRIERKAVGEDRPGEVTTRLAERYAEEVEAGKR